MRCLCSRRVRDDLSATAHAVDLKYRRTSSNVGERQSQLFRHDTIERSDDHRATLCSFGQAKRRLGSARLTLCDR